MKTNTEIKIGSSEKNDYRILGKYVDPFHTRIYSNKGQLFIEDLNSNFGTYVNNDKITKPKPISKNDRISIGYHKIRISELLNEDETGTADWKDLIIPGRKIDKNTFKTLVLIVICYPIIIGFSIPAILILINKLLDKVNLTFQLDVWEYSPFLYWIFGIIGAYILVVIIINWINGLKNTAGNN